MLEITGLRKSFNGHAVLRGVDLSVGKGELVSIIGHSGCGKSTLLSIVAGLLSADAGTAALDGERIVAPSPDRAVVFQHYSLLPWLSLEANVREAVRSARPSLNRAEVDERVQRYLTAVGLWSHRTKRPRQVSGGMQQRAAVARAFAVGPRMLLLDEPFGALDALTRARLQDELIELWSGESTVESVLMVTHGLEEAIFLADRIVVMGTAPNPSVVEVIDVPIPRPRDKTTIVHDPEYQRIYDRLMDLLARRMPLAAG